MSTNSGFDLNIQVLNIATNMGRVGGWVADSYQSKFKLIDRFMDETEGFLCDLDDKDFSEKFAPTLKRFKEEFGKLKNEPITEENKMLWAEKALTWGNILQHRSKLV